MRWPPSRPSSASALPPAGSAPAGRGMWALKPLLHEYAERIVGRIVAEMPAAREAMRGEEGEGFGLIGAGLQPQQPHARGPCRVLEVAYQQPAEAEAPHPGRDID